MRKTVIFFTSSTPEVGPAAAGFALAAGMVAAAAANSQTLAIWLLHRCDNLSRPGPLPARRVDYKDDSCYNGNINRKD